MGYGFFIVFIVSINYGLCMNDDELTDDTDEFYKNTGIYDEINDVDPALMGHLDIQSININAAPTSIKDSDFLELIKVLESSTINSRPLVWFTMIKCGVSIFEISEGFDVTEKEVTDEVSIFEELNLK